MISCFESSPWKLIDLNLIKNTKNILKYLVKTVMRKKENKAGRILSNIANKYSIMSVDVLIRSSHRRCSVERVLLKVHCKIHWKTSVPESLFLKSFT